MRVITGIARGRRLESPKGSDIVRPTTDKVKESLFSAINFDIPGSAVLDLFAGSGQLGIEALSRGAKSTVFVDSDISSVQLVKRNLETCRLKDNATVVHSDYKDYLACCNKGFDIVFIDPPYSLGIFDEAVLAASKRLNPDGIMVCEHPKEYELSDVKGFFRRDYSYGKISLTVLRNEADKNG